MINETQQIEWFRIVTDGTTGKPVFFKEVK